MTKDLSSCSHMMDLVRGIADVARRHGQNDFPAVSDEAPTASASLCGLTVFFSGRHVARIKTHDMDVQICSPDPVACLKQDASSGFSPISDHPRFYAGTPAHLSAWHARLVQLSSFFGNSPLLSSAQAA